MVPLDLQVQGFGLECEPRFGQQFESVEGKEEALVGGEADGSGLDVLLVGVWDEIAY